MDRFWVGFARGSPVGWCAASVGACIVLWLTDTDIGRFVAGFGWLASAMWSYAAHETLKVSDASIEMAASVVALLEKREKEAPRG